MLLNMDMEPYNTSELDLAAYLMALGGSQIGVDKSNRRALFLFELTQEQMDAIPRFYDGTGQVRALPFYNALQKLKREVG
jgi:hypothetical protein